VTRTSNRSLTRAGLLAVGILSLVIAHPPVAQARISRLATPSAVQRAVPAQLDLKVTHSNRCSLRFRGPRGARRQGGRTVRLHGRYLRIGWQTRPDAARGKWVALLRCGRGRKKSRWHSRARIGVRVVGFAGLHGSLIVPRSLRVSSSKTQPGSHAGSLPVTGDDYPYRNGPIDAYDRWGFNTRECTSFAAWRMNRDGLAFSNGMRGGFWGDASNWDDNAAALGYAVNGTPTVGSVAQWNANEGIAFGFGHLGYVARVSSDGTAYIEDYNGLGDHAYHSRWLRAPRYIHIIR
jgi:surface antigen